MIAHPDIPELRKREFDIGKHLLPWLVAHGYPVHISSIGRMGDLGNIPSYLETMLDILHGRFTSTYQLLARRYPDCADGLMIERETLELADPVSGLTLAEKMARGLVRISRRCELGNMSASFPASLSRNAISMMIRKSLPMRPLRAHPSVPAH